jgi:ribosomal protein S18 acetylase RimI-like enzyme
LFNAAVEVGRRAGAREVVLWVVNSNDSARAFYERKGMLPDGGAQEHRVSPEERLSEVRYRRALS